MNSLFSSPISSRFSPTSFLPHPSLQAAAAAAGLSPAAAAAAAAAAAHHQASSGKDFDANGSGRQQQQQQQQDKVSNSGKNTWSLGINSLSFFLKSVWSQPLRLNSEIREKFFILSAVLLYYSYIVRVEVCVYKLC